MDEKPLGGEQNGVEQIPSVDKPKGLGPKVMIWLSFFCALGFSTYFWLMGYISAGEIETKTVEKQEIEVNINSPKWQEVKTEAEAFKTAFSSLNELSNKRVSKEEILRKLFTYFTNDVTVKALSISSSGEIAVDGETDTYRKVADFTKALSSWDKISEAKIVSVGFLESEEESSQKKISFSLTAKIDMSKEESTEEEAVGEESQSPQGGENQMEPGVDEAL